MGSKAGHQEEVIVVRDHVGGRGNGVTGRARRRRRHPQHSGIICSNII